MTIINQSRQQDRNTEAIVLSYYSEIFVAGAINRTAIEQHFATDFVAHDLPTERCGRADYTQFMSTLTTSFHALTPIVACELFSCSNKVVARWSSSGNHCAEFMGMAATGRRVTLKGIDIFCLKEGKIVSLWQEIDRIGILQQISAPLPNGTDRASVASTN